MAMTVFNVVIVITHFNVSLLLVRTIYFFLVATEVMLDGTDVGEYVVFELGTFLYFTAFSYILLNLWCVCFLLLLLFSSSLEMRRFN